MEKLNREIEFEYGFQGENGIVKERLRVYQLPEIQKHSSYYNVLPIVYKRQNTSLVNNLSQEVFEGDILYDGKIEYVVVWESGGFQVKARSMDKYYASLDDSLFMEVVGNIYERENPQPVKGEPTHRVVPVNKLKENNVYGINRPDNLGVYLGKSDGLLEFINVNRNDKVRFPESSGVTFYEPNIKEPKPLDPNEPKLIPASDLKLWSVYGVNMPNDFGMYVGYDDEYLFFTPIYNGDVVDSSVKITISRDSKFYEFNPLYLQARADTQKSLMTEFYKAAKPLMEYLSKNHHPHMSVVVTSESAEMLEGKEMVRL